MNSAHKCPYMQYLNSNRCPEGVMPILLIAMGPGDVLGQESESVSDALRNERLPSEPVRPWPNQGERGRQNLRRPHVIVPKSDSTGRNLIARYSTLILGSVLLLGCAVEDARLPRKTRSSGVYATLRIPEPGAALGRNRIPSR